jgi:REP element-mobilizing transposase RayT
VVVIGYHLIITAYGWWLPNDPRGSTSQYISSDVIAELGELHVGRKKIQPASYEIRQFYKRAQQVLKHELLTFNEEARNCVGDGLGQCIAHNGYTCYAFSIMQDHAHALIRKHKHKAEEMSENIQRSSADLLKARGLRRLDHPVWSTGGWKVFLDTPDDIRRTIPYIENNPIKHRLPSQHWPFVAPYDNWTLRKVVSRG